MEIRYEEDTIPYQPHLCPTYLELRDLSIKFPPKEGDKKVKTLLFERHFENEIWSLSIQWDGSVSLYFSTGGGIIGAGGHPEIRGAPQPLLQKAQTLLDKEAQSYQSPQSWKLPQAGEEQLLILSPTKNFHKPLTPHPHPEVENLTKDCHKILAALLNLIGHS